MNILEYQDIIDKTAVYPKHLGPAYTTLGLIGELGEFGIAVSNDDRVNIKKEAGDVFWYVTATCTEFGIQVQEVFSPRTIDKLIQLYPDEAATEAIIMSAEVAEVVKKFCRDKTIDLTYLTTKLNHIIIQVLVATSHYGISMDEILEANYTKLIKRRETNTLHGSGDNREETINFKPYPKPW